VPKTRNPVRKRGPDPETNQKALLLAFLAKYQQVVEGALASHLEAHRQVPSDWGVGMVRYWKNAVSILKWLRARAAADGLPGVAPPPPEVPGDERV
jgi:hypothetical protein